MSSDSGITLEHYRQLGSANPLKLKFKKPPKKKFKSNTTDSDFTLSDSDSTFTPLSDSDPSKPKTKLKFKPKFKFKSDATDSDQPKSKIKLKFEPKPKINEPKIDEPESVLIQPRSKISLKKPLSFKKATGPIQFGPDGLPIASRENLDRMTPSEVSQFCSSWTLDKHLNALMVEISQYINIPSMSSTKTTKCQTLLKYKKQFPTGAKEFKQMNYENTYESFNWRKETTSNYRGKKWVLPHSTDFRNEVMAKYSEYRLTDKSNQLNRINPDKDGSIMKYQAVLGEFLDPKTPIRGMLGYHGLGSGKTRTSVELSTRFIKDGKKILVLLPGSLRSNFIAELYRYGSIEHAIGIPNYVNMPQQEKREKEKASNKVIKYYYDILTYNERGVYDKLKALTNPETGFLEDRLIIVDEIHNLVSRMANATNLSRQVYYFLMDKVYNCKMLFLSGTPLLNNAYELGVLFNVLRGKFRTKNGNFTLFPENEEEFNDKFVNIYDKSVINQQLFKRRISGLVSYYAGSTDKTALPEEIEHPVAKLPMSDLQFQLYLVERMSETKKGGDKKKRNVSESTGSAFRTYSRMVCNFAFPRGIIRPKPVSARDIRTFQKYQGKKLDSSKLDLDDIQDEIDPSVVEGFKRTDRTNKKNDPFEEDDILSGRERVLTKKQRQETYALQLQDALIELESISDEIFPVDKLMQYSPKMWKLYNNMTKAEGNDGLIYIYTEFRILEGIRIIGSVLKFNGYEKAKYTDINGFGDFKKKYPAGTNRYGIISSAEDSKQRKILLEVYNHPENAHGEYIKVILGTSASSEGINLKRVRQIHILEPYWNMVRNNQVKGRGIRFGSHVDLPQEEQNVHIFSYQVTLTELQQKEIIELLDSPREAYSTDEHIYRLALTKDVINSQFLKMIKEAATDCGLNFLVNVQKDPDLRCLDIPKDIGEYLYVPNIYDDPEDQEFMKSIKYEDYIVNRIKFDQEYGYKAHLNGRPILDPPMIMHQGKPYHQVLTLYDYDLLKSGIEVKQKYYVVGTKIIINLN